MRNYDLLIGAELEFECVAAPAEICGVAVKKERGAKQYELAFPPYFSADKLVDILIAAKLELNKYNAIFSKKPDGEPYNALQINISLWHDGKNLFERRVGSDERYEDNPLLMHVIAGNLAMLKRYLPIFAPHLCDMERFNHLHPINATLIANGLYNAPCTISWGGCDNRTVALRLAGTGVSTRLEHRVPSSGSDPLLVVNAILQASIYGIDNKLYPENPRTYGNSYDEIYQLPRIC